MAKKKKKRKSRALVTGHLERVASTAFTDFKKQLTEIVGKQHGIYSLYKGDRLYYVGLATNLKRRIDGHMRDKHAGKWNRFSLYLVRKVDHIKELESLILRIADPKGNLIKGKLKGSKNLWKDLEKSIRNEYNKRIQILKEGISTVKAGKGKAQSKSSRKELRGLVNKKTRLYKRYKGKDYHAYLFKGGTVKVGNTNFDSLTSAAKSIVKRSVNGWGFWRIKNKDGKWVKMIEMFKQGSKKRTKRKKKDIDAIIVPAREKGFNKVFLGEDCWHAIRIGKKKIDSIKYIVAYQVRPISAITHYAKVKEIKPYKKTGKFLIVFKSKAKKIGPIPLRNSKIPYGPVFTTYNKLIKAKKLDDVF